MKLLLLISAMFLILCGSFAQSSVQSSLSFDDIKKKSSNKDFLLFLGQFSQVAYPFNSKKRLTSTSALPKELKTLHVSKFLKVARTDMFYETYDFNYDDEKISNAQKKLKYYYPIVASFSNKYIVVVYGCWFALGTEDYSDTYNYLVTFNYNGGMIDRLILINGNSNSNSNWNEYILINPNTLKLFKYDINKKNRTNEGDIINKKEPLSICLIEDYVINENGKISKPKSNTIYLNQHGYKWYDPKAYPDDPMNKY